MPPLVEWERGVCSDIHGYGRMSVTGHLHGERACYIHLVAAVHVSGVVECPDSPEMTEVHVILCPDFQSEEQKRNTFAVNLPRAWTSILLP